MKIVPMLALLLMACVGEAESQCVLVRDGASMTMVQAESSSAVIRFAAEELQRYVAAMSAAEVHGGIDKATSSGRPASNRSVKSRPPASTCAVTLALDPSLGWDTFRIEASRTSVRVSGGNERAVLFGVYQILRDLGVRFIAPGVHGENVPRKSTLSLRTGARTYRPDLRYRGLIVQRPLTEGTLLIADWMAKNQMNYWVNPNRVFEGAGDDLQRRFVDALERRGIIWEYGHHTFAHWIAKGDHDPEILGLKSGVRTAAAICISKQRAAERVADNMAAFVARWPEVDVLSLWPNDAVHGWCECDPCREFYGDLPSWRGVAPLMTLPYFRFVDRVAAILPERGVTQPVGALAYKNTIQPVGGLVFPDNFLVTVAPIDRNYARPLADLDYFGPVMSEWTELLGERSAPGQSGARVMAYEYYAGQYANNSLPMPAVTALAGDIEGYRQSGFGGITIQAEEGHWGTYVLDFHALARMSFHGPMDPKRLIAEFSSDYYGPASAPMTEYWMSQEELIRSQTDIGGAGQFFHLLRNTAGAIEKLDNLVAQAENLADSEVVRNRVHYSRLSVEYVKLLRDAINTGRIRTSDTLPPTPKGTGHLAFLGVEDSVQIRIPVEVNAGVEVALGNVVPVSGGGTSYQIEVRRDAADGPVVHKGGIVSGSVEQAFHHLTGRSWAGDNRNLIDLSGHLAPIDRERGWLDLFVTAHVIGDGWTMYRDHDDGGRWDMKAVITPVSAAEERALAWQRLQVFVETHAQSGIFNDAPEFVLRVNKQVVDANR